MRWSLALTVTVAALAALSPLAGCGGESSAPSPQPGSFEAALATVGGGGEGASLGVGWAAESELATLPPRERRRLEAALAPNATSVLDASRPLTRRYGFDPRRARELISVGGSYAFGLRLDGVSAGRLARALAAEGARLRRAHGVTLLEVGGYASVPDPLLGVGVTGLGARDAFARERVVLAISEPSRAALLGEGGRLLEQPAYAAAADCLGDVVVARLVPAKLLQSTELGTDLVAVGVHRLEPGGGEAEALCLIGSDAEEADRLAAALESSLAPDARDPFSGTRIGAALSSAQVERLDAEGLEVVRAELALRSGEPRGFVLRALAGGSLAAYLAG